MCIQELDGEQLTGFIIIAESVDISKHFYINLDTGGTTTTKVTWDNLCARHKNEGPICQVNLLQKALATKFTKDTPLPETGHQICGDIKHAFTISTLNEELLCCITLMNALEDFPHLRTSISTRLTTSKVKTYTSENILALLENEHSL